MDPINPEQNSSHFYYICPKSCKSAVGLKSQLIINQDFSAVILMVKTPIICQDVAVIKYSKNLSLLKTFKSVKYNPLSTKMKSNITIS